MAASTFDSQEDAGQNPNYIPEQHYNIGQAEYQSNFDADEFSTARVRDKHVDNIPEEECWLFKPPNSSTFISATSCLLWAREVFDSPSSQFYHRRRDLLNRLEIIIATEPFKRLPNLGGSVPDLNSTTVTAASVSTPLTRLEGVGGGSGESLLPGSSATFIRPKHRASEVISQHTRQRSSPSAGNRSSGSTDDLQNVADLRTIARKQEDELKAEVAAISAHQQQASRNGGSQQSLNRSGHESPYGSQPRLNVSLSPTPSDIAKQQMATLRLSLDNQQQNPGALLRRSEESLECREESLEGFAPTIAPLGTQQAVIVGRPTGKLISKLPAPVRRGPRFPSAEALPSFGWGGDRLRRNSQEQLASRRIPMPPPRSGSLLSGTSGFQQ